MKQRELCDAIIIQAESILRDVKELKEKEQQIRNDERKKVIEEYRKGVEELSKSPYATKDNLYPFDSAFKDITDTIDTLVVKKDILKEGKMI